MNDPWDVKTVRESGQYVSCIKLSGVPLLPPVLSKECRKEMQYYKLLAKEVENRIAVLKSFFCNETDSADEKEESDGAAIENRVEIPQNALKAGFGINIEKITAIANNKSDYTTENVIATQINTNCSNSPNLSISSNVVVRTTSSMINPPKLIIDLSLSINETGKHILESLKSAGKNPAIGNIELPEHDYEYKKPETKKVECTKPMQEQPECNKPQKELILDVERNNGASKCRKESPEPNKETPENALSPNCSFHSSMESYPTDDANSKNELPDSPSTSCKSVSGSLNDVNAYSSEKPTEDKPQLVRQHSYTILKPSPQLLAHLKNQSYNTGLEMAAISMSESISNLNSSPNRKRRSWDLETAKVKWSSMAMELKQANVDAKKVTRSNSPVKNGGKTNNTKTSSPSRQRSRSVAENCVNRYKSPKVDAKESKQVPVEAKEHKLISANNIPSNVTIVKESATKTAKKVVARSTPTSPRRSPPLADSPPPPDIDKVREVYEKIQKQQLTQITSLIEKQKKEQMLLQQVFEKQNSKIFQQLNLSPKKTSPVKIGAVKSDEEKGPVSLSQVINNNSDNSLSETIAQTNNCITRCELIMKKSKDIKSTIKKQIAFAQRANNRSQAVLEGSRTRTNSPLARKLNYDSTSDYSPDPVLSDRTNDTLADLHNMTFPSDSDDSCVTRQMTSRQPRSPLRLSSPRTKTYNNRTDNAITNLEHTIQNSMKSMNTAHSPTNRSDRLRPKEERDAATTIVAHAKGYLIRRLMRTEKVRATVGTIKEALECALALHRDRAGIRGADVDLHRRLIQQITAACYSLHETFVASTPAQRCAVIAADRARLRALAAKTSPVVSRSKFTPRIKKSDLMSQSHSGSFPTRAKRVSPASFMTQSNYECRSSGIKGGGRPRYIPSPRHRASRPWR